MLKPIKTNLLRSPFKDRMEVNGKLMNSLEPKRLMANYYIEAGLTSNDDMSRWNLTYDGWEKPEMQVRGCLAGHYLSAAAMLYDLENDFEYKTRADFMVREFTKCGKAHLDNWCFSIPQLYLEWIMKDKWVWAPQYVIHKTMMGLVDAYKYSGNKEALDTAEKAADWFYNWVKDFDRVKTDQMLKWETGGLMEVWCDLYEITSNEKYRVLLEKYCRRDLFESMVKHEKDIRFYHANTTIPEAIGCARAYEVTGEVQYRDMAVAFWENAVEGRDILVTGTQNTNELWVDSLAGRDTYTNQEFCTVYNLVRLADFLFRWTGNMKYADYIERAYYNGFLAQQHKITGQNTYFLPLAPASKKAWKNITDEMYCCYGTQIQAHSSYGYRTLYENESGDIIVSQYVPCTTVYNNIKLDLYREYSVHNTKKQDIARYVLKLSSGKSCKQKIILRKPWWVQANDINVTYSEDKIDIPNTDYITVDCDIKGTQYIIIEMKMNITAYPMGESPERYAFMYGPMTICGLIDCDIKLKGDIKNPNTMFRSMKTLDDSYITREWWTTSLDSNIKFVPLYEITDETYSTYFMVD